LHQDALLELVTTVDAFIKQLDPGAAKSHVRCAKRCT
jgi:hypothetical protein